MSELSWYWNRLRAMGPEEVALHLRKKLRQRSDARRVFPSQSELWDSPGPYPVVPAPEAAPSALREKLRHHASRILLDRWEVFGHTVLHLDSPPRWHRDYLAGPDVPTDASAFRLNHRALPFSADIKLIWELSRWSELSRLAQAAYVLRETAWAEKVVSCLENWVQCNPPYSGWNWVSALESGLRLVQWVWIDALLLGCCGQDPGLLARLRRLRAELLPGHCWHAWRHRSFGSSANNHLLGELAGLIVAVARWPNARRYAPAMGTLQKLWEREVLAQFAPDGGNREQALNYHLFSFEFCWQVRNALKACGRAIGPEVEERLARAARFYVEVQAPRDPWDYGDSDSAWVVPLFLDSRTRISEWHNWLARIGPASALDYWLGDPPVQKRAVRRGRPLHTREIGDWWLYPDSGIAICESGFWFLRWDLSPLGYLKTAAHGHLDFLHLSIWRKGVALVVDPGTGAYYADPALRHWLASRGAHNGPAPFRLDWPERLGPFLWSEGHSSAHVAETPGNGIQARGHFPQGPVIRRVIPIGEGRDGWRVEDEWRPETGEAGFSVHWQFAPGTVLRQSSSREWVLKRHDVEMRVWVGSTWDHVEVVEASAEGTGHAGLVSRNFRELERGPYLKLMAQKPCVFETAFLASPSP